MSEFGLVLVAITCAAVPFALGLVTATWRSRRALAQRSRTLTLDLGPKVLLGVGLTTAAPLTLLPTRAAATAVQPLPTLDRVIQPPAAAPPTPAHTAPHRVTEAQGAKSRTHVVRPGESLWSITATELGPTATTSDIAATWPRLWALNREIIGPDPGLLFPGQRLQLPADLGDRS